MDEGMSGWIDEWAVEWMSGNERMDECTKAGMCELID